MNILEISWVKDLDVVWFGLIMVFVILILLVLALNLFTKIIAPKVRVSKTAKAKQQKSGVEHENDFIEDHLSANDSAAIAMALYLFYADVHDEESNKITIKTVERRYSPWSSKIYGLNNLQR